MKNCFCTVVAIGCGLLFTSHAQAQVVYTISASTAFGNNGANAGAVPPTFTDNMDGTFSLANGIESAINNAVFITSSDVGSVSTALGRALTSDDVVTVSGTIASSDVNFNANGIEFGLQSAPGFRSNPNLLLQIDADGERGGFAPFFGTPTPNTNTNRNQIPGATEPSLMDGFSFTVTYTATDITYSVTDIITTNETGTEPAGATSLTFSFSDGAAGDPILTTALDDYVANFPTLVGDSFAYFSHQRNGAAVNIGTTISSFEIEVTTPGAPVCMLADVDMNGVVNILDISPFIVVLSSGAFQCEADIDENGVVNILDISPFIAILSSP